MEMFSYLQKAGVSPPPLSLFQLKNEDILEGVPLACVGITQVRFKSKKVGSNEIRFSRVLQEVKGAQMILIDLK